MKTRKGRVDFVPYLEVHTVYVCRAGDKDPVRSAGDLAGKVIAVQSDTVAEEEVKQEVEWLNEQGFAHKDILRLERSADLFDAIRDGRADVTFADQPVANYYAKHDHRLVVTGRAGGRAAPERIGIALRKQDKELQAAVAQAIERLKDDDNGTFDRLYKKWIGQ
jgi:polar amino acid transport system substrate-binding protein